MSELTHINCVALTARFPVGKPVVPAALMNRPTRGERRFAYWLEQLANMVEHDTLVYSKNIKDTVSEDQRAIETFQQRVISGNLLGFHCPAVCHFIKRTVEKEGGTYKCHHCDKGKAIVQDASADSGPKDGPPPTRSIVEKEDVPTTSSKQVD